MRFIDLDELLEELYSGKCENDLLRAVRQALVNELISLSIYEIDDAVLFDLIDSPNSIN